MDSKSANKSVLESLIVVHLDELVQIHAVKIKDAAKMVPEDEVVPQLDYSLDVVGVTFLQQKKQLSLDSRLVVVLLLVLD